MRTKRLRALLAVADVSNSLFVDEFRNPKGKLSAKKIAKEYIISKKHIRFILDKNIHPALLEFIANELKE